MSSDAMLIVSCVSVVSSDGLVVGSGGLEAEADCLDAVLVGTQ